MYQRVIPRDLFNESKLLKCMGQLAVLVHDGLPWRLDLEHDQSNGPGFEIDQDESDGGLYVNNLHLTLRLERGATEIPVKSIYNSKEPYPLVFTDHLREERLVLHTDGSLHVVFKTFLDVLSSHFE